MHATPEQASTVYATVTEGSNALVEINGSMLQVVVVRSGSLATRMISVLLYATLMSLIGHIILTILFESYQCIQQRYARHRGREIQLEEGPAYEDCETAQVAERQEPEPAEKLITI